MNRERSASWAREMKARHAATAAISACLCAFAYIWTGSLTTALLLALLILFGLELSWVLFAFEASPEYQAVRNRDADGLIGTRGVVLAQCSPRGQIKLWGEVWQAESSDGSPIAVGETAVVTGSRGLVLLVARE